MHILLIDSIVERIYIEQINNIQNYRYNLNEYFLNLMDHDDEIHQANYTIEYLHTKLFIVMVRFFEHFFLLFL